MVGGCASNVASTLKNLDCPLDLRVPVGRGPYADIISRTLEQSGYDIQIRDESQDNGYCQALVEATGEGTFITVQGSEGTFKEQCLMWVNVNGLSIVMWIMMWASGDKSAVLIIIMDVINLCNSAYGYWNWRKLSKPNPRNGIHFFIFILHRIP